VRDKQAVARAASLMDRPEYGAAPSKQSSEVRRHRAFGGAGDGPVRRGLTGGYTGVERDSSAE
jgi:hypothetical protein